MKLRSSKLTFSLFVSINIVCAIFVAFLIYVNKKILLGTSGDIIIKCFLLIWPIFILLALSVLSVVEINKKGISIKQYFRVIVKIDWDEAKEVGVGTHHNELWIYVSTYCLDDYQRRNMRAITLNNEIIKVRYSKRAFKGIKMFYKNEIICLNNDIVSRIKNN